MGRENPSLALTLSRNSFVSIINAREEKRILNSHQENKQRRSARFCKGGGPSLNHRKGGEAQNKGKEKASSFSIKRVFNT